MAKFRADLINIPPVPFREACQPRVSEVPRVRYTRDGIHGDAIDPEGGVLDRRSVTPGEGGRRRHGDRYKRPDRGLALSASASLIVT